MKAILAAALLFLMTSQPSRADPAAGLERAIAATLVVHSNDATESFLGSAFLWKEGDIAITCAHVVGRDPDVRVTFADGHDELARVLARDPIRDVAVLSVQGGRGQGLEPAPAPAELGQTVYAVGAPLGVEFTVTRGMASARPRQLDPSVPIRLIQHDAAVNNGNSGGPLVDIDGRVLGMNSQIVNGAPNFIGLSFAISVEDLQRIVPLLLSDTLRPVVRLGIKVRAVDGEIAAALGIARAKGVLVDEVRPRRIAARAGLLAGDVITAMNGKPITAPGEMAFQLEDAAPAGQVTLDVMRGGMARQLVLDIGRVVHRPRPTPAPPAAEIPWSDLGLQLDDHANITSVAPGHVAAFAGVKQGEQVMAVNGKPLDRPEAIAGWKRQTVTGPLLLLLRKGKDTTHVILDPWHPWFNPQVAIGVGAGPDQVAF